MTEHETPLCRHSSIEVYLDTESEPQKFFAECNVCEAVGPLRKIKGDAIQALKDIVSYREHGQGGYRKNAGRPKSVPNSTKTRGFEVDDKRFTTFKKWMKTNGFTKNSAAIRWIFDNLDNLKVPKKERA